MLLDEVMPEFDARASYETLVLACPERVYACIWTADFDHWGVRSASMVSGCPGRHSRLRERPARSATQAPADL
jgi:hypothetical protein